MPLYQYEARTADGKLLVGTAEAESPEIVMTQLQEQGNLPIKVELLQKKKSSLGALLKLDLFGKGKVAKNDLMNFCRQMYTALRVGIPITDTFSQVIENTSSKPLKSALEDIGRKVFEGQALSVSMESYPKIFNSTFVAMINAGERSGSIDNAFLTLQKQIAFEIESLKKLKTATRYPIMVIGAALIGILVVNFFVIPKFAELYASFQTQLPLPTRLLIGLSTFVTTYWLYLGTAFFLLIIALKIYLHQPSGRFLWDRWKLKIPIFGSLLYQILIARFVRTFASMLQAGIVVTESMRLAANNFSNLYLEKSLDKMTTLVEEGVSLGQAMSSSQLFPPLVLQILRISEKTGQIDSSLIEIADYYDREIDYKLTHLSDILQPILIILVAIMVLILALGVFLPMWKMIQFAGR